jgi:pimeloyl-ACP methyl ester carboxylesterase
MSDEKEAVALVHGLFGFPWLMSLLGKRLKRQGYATRNWGYPSVVGSVERHASKLREVLGELETAPDVSRIHLVAHSMGGIVGWCALREGIPRKFGRFVLLTPPGRGSWAATAFGRPLRRICPAIEQLSTKPDSLVNRLEPLDGIDIGVIGASLDLVVPATNSHVPGEREHRIYPGLHHQVLFRADVADAIGSFLKTGEFSPSAGPSASPAM